MNKTKCPPNTIQISTCLPVALTEQAHIIHKARKRTAPMGWEPKLHLIYQEAFAEGIRRFDPETGYLKARPREQLAVAILPNFDCSRYSREKDLFRVLDESGMMAWVCDTHVQNLHVTPALERYTGRSGPEFRRLGWVDLLHPADRAITLRNCEQRMERQESFSFVYRILRFDERYGLIVDYAQPRYASDGRLAGYVGIMHQLPPGALVVLLPDQQDARGSVSAADSHDAGSVGDPASRVLLSL